MAQMQSKPGKLLPINSFGGLDAAQSTNGAFWYRMTFSFWWTKESTGFVKKSQLCQHPDAYTGVNSGRPRSGCKTKRRN